MMSGLIRERILTCISLNNEAVMLLSAGDDRKALRLLKKGVKIVRDALSCPPAVSAPLVVIVTSSNGSSGPKERGRGGGHWKSGHLSLDDTGTTLPAALEPEPAPAALPRPRKQTASATISGACEEEEEHDRSLMLLIHSPIQLLGMTRISPRDQDYSFILNRVFLMSPFALAAEEESSLDNKKWYNKYRDEELIDPELHAAITATLLFTMAMTYHRLACQATDATTNANNKKARDAHTCKAIELYSTVLRLAHLDDSSCPCSGLSCDAIIGILCCAALNNRSLLMFERGEYVSASEGFDLLHRLLFSSRWRFQEGVMLQLEELDGLMLNILLLRQPPLAAAA